MDFGARRDAGRVDEQRDPAALARVQAQERLLEAQRRERLFLELAAVTAHGRDRAGPGLIGSGGPLRIGVGHGQRHQLDRTGGQQELARVVLEDRAQLDELRDERAQPAVSRQPLERERHGHPRPLAGCAGWLVADMQIRIGIVACGREEPRLDGALRAHALDPPGALGEPDVAQSASEDAALAAILGQFAECAEAAIDRRSA